MIFKSLCFGGECVAMIDKSLEIFAQDNGFN